MRKNPGAQDQEKKNHSAGAAKEIRELIDHSNRQVERGTDLVNKSGEALNSIVSSIKQVTSIISEISAASQELAP